ncbi:hypothetical protein M427DRAFT_204986 [Gonapodya prolifera JEL478]|uniref:Uncharacterized protein n=1 Tax=Gonapodya prolifera (strain JEL478) TaxID=1344416 RepID=A0A138ZZC2_GONPJ|nr:hypothetical protein M427DRAFT_204986 [Gonapodya prolifera JEL478]|eukprot:KXS09857.1 hypothetical protein M427DRAFT_204986 [Gonapodya prolifera JEL478]
MLRDADVILLAGSGAPWSNASKSARTRNRVNNNGTVKLHLPPVSAEHSPDSSSRTTDDIDSELASTRKSGRRVEPQSESREKAFKSNDALYDSGAAVEFAGIYRKLWRLIATLTPGQRLPRSCRSSQLFFWYTIPKKNWFWRYSYRWPTIDNSWNQELVGSPTRAEAVVIKRTCYQNWSFSKVNRRLQGILEHSTNKLENVTK